MGVFSVFKLFDAKYLARKFSGETTVREKFNRLVPYIKEKSQRFIEECHIAREKLKDLPATNYELGLKHMKKGNISDAILRFRIVAFLKPEFAPAYYNLGRCYAFNGKNDLAKKNFEKALELDSNLNDAKYQLAKLQQPESLKFVPLSLIKEQADILTEAYKVSSEVEDSNHREVLNLIFSNIQDKNPNLEVLDIGCGVGVFGRLLREKDVIKKLVGIDFSEGLVKITSDLTKDKAKIYDNVLEKDAVSYLSLSNEKFDLILADMPFYYFGDLSEISTLLRKNIKPGGLLAFFTVVDKQIREYKLDIRQDNFIHSAQYIKDSLAKAGFSEVVSKELQADEEFAGIAFVYRLN